MTEKIITYRSTSGTTYESEYNALRDDLRHMLILSGAVNEASANSVTDFLTSPFERLSSVIQLLNDIQSTHPDLKR